MLKFVLIVCLVAACQAQESTTGSGFQNFFNKIKDAGSKVDFAQLSAGAAKAQETFGPMISQFKEASKPIQNKLAEVGLVPTTTANPVGGVLKHLQVVGIGSDIDVAKVQENMKKAQDTLGPLWNQFSSFTKKTSSGAAQPPPAASAPAPSSIDQYIIEDPAAAPSLKSAAPPAAPPAAPAVAPAAPAGSPPSKSTNFQGALQTLQDVGSKIDINQVKEGAQKVQSFFSQFSKKSGTTS